MKKKLSAFAALLTAAAMMLTACGSSAGSSDLRFATGGTTGTYYAYGGVLANVLNTKLDGTKLTVQSTGASKANIFLIDDGEAEVAVVQNDVMDYAYNGTDLFAEDGAVTSFSAVAGLYSEVVQIIATPDITSIDDLKGKRVSVGDAGSGVEFNANQILAAYGMTFDDIDKQNLSFGDSASAIKDGKLDAAFVTAGPPTTAVTELATTNDITLLSIDDAHAQALAAEHPFYTQYTIPAGTYKGVDADVNTVAVKATMIVSNELSEDVVYNIVKNIFENKDEITASHDKGSELDTAYAVEGISVPFHAGAEKYFKEIGVLK